MLSETNIIHDIIFYFQIRPVPDNVRHFIFFFCHWTAMAGTLLNPLVYAYYNENFRRQIQVRNSFHLLVDTTETFRHVLERCVDKENSNEDYIQLCLGDIHTGKSYRKHSENFISVIGKLSEVTMRETTRNVKDKLLASSWLTIKPLISKYLERIFNSISPF